MILPLGIYPDDACNKTKIPVHRVLCTTPGVIARKPECLTATDLERFWDTVMCEQSQVRRLSTEGRLPARRQKEGLEGRGGHRESRAAQTGQGGSLVIKPDQTTGESAGWRVGGSVRLEAAFGTRSVATAALLCFPPQPSAATPTPLPGSP